MILFFIDICKLHTFLYIAGGKVSGEHYQCPDFKKMNKKYNSLIPVTTLLGLISITNYNLVL